MTPSTVSHDPQLEQVFTPDMAQGAGWMILGTSTVSQTGLIAYARKRPVSAVHYCVCDHNIVVALSTRRDVAEYMATRRQPR